MNNYYSNSHSANTNTNSAMDDLWDNMSDRQVWEVAASLLFDNDPEEQHQGDQCHADDAMEIEGPLDLGLDQQQQRPVKRINRRREEILFLRGQVQQLQQRITSTQRRLQHTQIETSDALTPRQSELLSHAWSDIAAHQLAERHQAEHEHERLLALVDEQRQHAKALHRYARRLQNRPIPPQLARYAQLQAPTSQPLAESESLDTPAAFATLERAVESMYFQRDSIFQDPRFHDVLSSFREWRVVNEHTKRVCVELLDTRVVPFDVETTANAVWRSMVDRLAPVPLVTYKNEEFEAEKDQIRKGFVAVLDMPHVHATVRGKVVAQRIVEKNRVVILRATLFEPITMATENESDSSQAFAPEPFSAHHYQWTVIEAPHHERLQSSSQKGHALAQIESFDLSFPKLETTTSSGGASHEDEGVEQAIVAFCHTAGEYHLDLSRQAVENILVMEAMERGRSSGNSTSTSTASGTSTRAGPRYAVSRTSAMKLEAC